ncbi:MAG: aminotransferase class I/II-fold pyridoxal phosphate-dependent enzyme [Acidobacteriia bacterium]|nr:aminotransferase class I/II-fold pyridoxal phosphate-dependent enzyme [Terriglobia bacterium]
MDFRTRCARGTGVVDDVGHPLAPPIVTASTFAFSSQQEVESYYTGGRGWLYSRYGNPTVRAAERLLAELEGAQEAALFSSGMAATSTTVLSLVRSGERIAAQRELYGGTAGLFRDVLPRLGIETTWFALDEIAGLTPEGLEGCRLLWVESPTNPALRIVDLDAAARAAHAAGALAVVDGTFATPALQRPLALGCDVVVHSGTKYLGGHGDVTAGAVAGSRDLMSAIMATRRSLGGTLDPFAAFLLQRGMRTLAVRMESHERGASAVARALSGHPRVRRVLWPGLADHPDHALAGRQMAGFGGMVTFEVEGGAAGAERVHDRLRLFAKAASLGGVESLVSIPARMSHRGLPPEELERAGVTPGMLRLSVGLESPEDLVADLLEALGG